MTNHQTIKLGVNVDHIATLREARGTDYPDPAMAADIARKAGADGVTIHLREDRRHIQDRDVKLIAETISLPMNFEMAATPEMLRIAKKIRPQECCIVPEKREELTTEGGLLVTENWQRLRPIVDQLKETDIRVSIFIDPDRQQIEACKKLGVDAVEIHTGRYAEAVEPNLCSTELAKVIEAVKFAYSERLIVNAGHGLHYQNVKAIAKIKQVNTLNIGHSIVSRAVLTGFHEAVHTMKKIIIDARLNAEGVS